MNIKLPKEIKVLPRGPHKRDLIRNFIKSKKRKRKEVNE